VNSNKEIYAFRRMRQGGRLSVFMFFWNDLQIFWVHFTYFCLEKHGKEQNIIHEAQNAVKTDREDRTKRGDECKNMSFRTTMIMMNVVFSSRKDVQTGDIEYCTSILLTTPTLRCPTLYPNIPV
jgi:hypothetical protein